MVDYVKPSNPWWKLVSSSGDESPEVSLNLGQIEECKSKCNTWPFFLTRVPEDFSLDKGGDPRLRYDAHDLKDERIERWEEAVSIKFSK